MKILAFTFALLAATSAQAEPDRISLLIGSHHIGAIQQFQESNPGIFLTWEDRSGFDLSFGAYQNSYGKSSVAATAALPILRGDNADLSVFAGVALYPGDGHNFAIHAGDLVPVGGLQLRVGNVFVQAMPGDGKAVDGIVSFGLTWALK